MSEAYVDPMVMQLQAQMNEPKSSVCVFSLPCGYLDGDNVLHAEVVIRELTGAEEDLLANRSMSTIQKLNELLARCTDRIGTITDKGKISQIIKDLPAPDRVYLMLCIRRVALGDQYFFTEACPECKAEGKFVQNLAELAVKSPQNPYQRVFDDTLPSGLTVRYRYMTGHDEEKLSKSANSADALSLAILTRLELIDGKPPTMLDVKAMKMRDRHAIRALFEQREGGVDTDLELSCPACGYEFKTDLNIGQGGFFFPSQDQMS